VDDRLHPHHTVLAPPGLSPCAVRRRARGDAGRGSVSTRRAGMAVARAAVCATARGARATGSARMRPSAGSLEGVTG